MNQGDSLVFSIESLSSMILNKKKKGFSFSYSEYLSVDEIIYGFRLFYYLLLLEFLLLNAFAINCLLVQYIIEAL